MPPALRNCFLQFRSDARGAAAVEFGFVGLMFITGVLNAFELGRFAYQKMQVENAAYAGAQRAWKTCKETTMLPATQNQNCPGLNAAVTAAIQATSLGTKVALSSTGITDSALKAIGWPVASSKINVTMARDKRSRSPEKMP